MVVTEREPSPQQGQSPNLSDANIKDGIETGLSPVPPSHSSTEDRSSSGLGNCTDQELSDCPITPLTPPASLTFLQPFPSECETPAATTPFPKCSEEEEGYEDEAYQSVRENEQDESKKPVSSFEEKSTGIESALEHLEEGEIDGEGEMDSATLVEDQQMKDIEKCLQEEKELEKCMEEVSEDKESTEPTETRIEEIEKTLEFSGKSDKCTELLEQTEPNIEESDKCSESFEHTENKMEITESVVKSKQIAEEETKFEDTSEQKETKFEERTSEKSLTEESECRESYEQKEIVVEQVDSTKVSEQSVSVEKVKVEEISVNQLWNLWSSNAPKVTEETKEEQRIEESPSAGQIGEEKMEENEKDELKEQSEIVEKQETVDDLNDTRMKLGDAERRLHEMEVEIKRLENEREELNSAYREAEALRKQEEAKAQRLTAELTQVRHEYEKRLIAKEEEIESLRKQMQIEIEQLSQRVAEAEAKVKTEVARIKKKMQVQITELEMSLDVANKQNIDLQKTIKKQSLQITELQAHYDEIHRQLQQTVDQLGVSQRRCQALQAELEETRVNLEQALRAKRISEQQVEEATSRINELNTLNVNLTSAKSKLEAEFMSLQSDYEEINKELRISDERYNRVQIELKSTKDVLIEEQERLVKIESIKKSLEIEVHNLTVRIEEVEANALAGGKRVISKLESRIRDMEIELEEEKRRHVETQKVLRKKEHRIKELIVQAEEDHQTLVILNDSVDKLSEKCKMYKRQLAEQEGMSQQNLTRVRRFQRELEAAEERADQAESNLNLIRAKHRSWVTTSQIPGGLKQVIVTEETSSTTSQY